MVSHTSQPIPVRLSGDVYRVFFSCRNAENVSSVGFVDFNLRDPQRPIRISENPVLSPGAPGTFDENGISIGCIVPRDGKYWLYYLGWNLLVSVPWHNSIGLAIADSPDGPFVRASQAPILDRNALDPFSLSYPWVMFDQGMWRMWYGSNLRWGAEQRDMDHVIKYAESSDGVVWRPTGKIAIGIEAADEYAFSRPCVRRGPDKYQMWYAFRGPSYRIGYAESDDGVVWRRLDNQVGITVSPDGWDSEAVSYAHVFDHEGTMYMVYNGNKYARTGFGLAVLEDGN